VRGGLSDSGDWQLSHKQPNERDKPIIQDLQARLDAAGPTKPDEGLQGSGEWGDRTSIEERYDPGTQSDAAYVGRRGQRYLRKRKKHWGKAF